MKYLKYRQSFLNEKFESQFLTKTTGWLSKMKLNSKPFIEDLKKICENNSIPLSSITDNFFDVNILANKAIKMRAPEDSVNHTWAIKFWFSATDGYKGFSVTPNRSGERVKSKSESRKFEPFEPEEISLLKEKAVSASQLMGVDLTKGELSIVDNDYVKDEKLKSGDIIAFYNCGSDINYSRDYSYHLNWAKIFSSHDEYGRFRSYVAYGKNLSGGSADYYYDENGVEYASVIDHLYSNVSDRERNYIGSWILSESGVGLQSDNYKVHLYKHTSEDLHVVGDTSKKDENEDPNTWNLSVRKDINSLRTFEIQKYDRSDEKNKSIYKEDLEDSDFAIIFYIDEFLPQMEGDLTSIRKERTESKSGATALMSNEEIKKINVDKRLDYLVDRMKIDQNLKIDEMSNLKSILLKILKDDYVIITLFRGFNASIISGFYYFFDGLESIEKLQNEEQLKNYVESSLQSIKEQYRKLLEDYQSTIPKFKNSYELIMKSDNEKLKEVFENILRIGKKFTTKIRSREIVNLYDISIIISNLQNIHNIHDTNRLSYRTIRIMEEFRYSDEVENMMRNFDDDDYNKSMKGIKFMERMIDLI
jgi:hypothetical protein